MHSQASPARPQWRELQPEYVIPRGRPKFVSYNPNLPAELQALMIRNFPADWSEKDTRALDLASVLAADAVEKCGSGHSGTAMSLAPLAYTLYQRVLRHNPQNPTCVGRDRFSLSCGHSSLTQYIQLYLGGFG